jgi:hypothetical protein
MRDSPPRPPRKRVREPYGRRYGCNAPLPQFIDPAAGSVPTQSLALGSIQIAISVSLNALIALAAGAIALSSASGRAGFCCSAG